MRGGAEERRYPPARPRLLVVAGSKGGVGTTTISVNLAVAAATAGKRCVLADGHLGRSGVAPLCGTRERYTIADVLAGRRTVRETLQPGPAGVGVLPGVWAAAQVTDCASAAQERVLADLWRLHDFDLVVIDAGNGINHVMRRFCAAADDILIITSPDSPAIMGCYTVLKTLRSTMPRVSPSFAVNLASAGQADDTEARLMNACRRFLAWQPRCLGHLPIAEAIAAASRARSPWVLTAPRSPEAQQINTWAIRLSHVTGESNESRKRFQVA